MLQNMILAESFSYGDVELLPSCFLDRFNLNRQYLQSLDANELLFNFWDESVLPIPSTYQQSRHYGGWESSRHRLCRGAFAGHFLSACARIYSTINDEMLKDKADYIVKELRRCQNANGNGYLAAFSERFFDLLEARASGRATTSRPRGAAFIEGVPYYTMHKHLMGLYEMFKYAANTEAFQVLEALIEHVRKRVNRLSDGQMQKVLDTEFGGMPEVLYDFFEETSDPSILDLAKRFEHDKVLNPLVNNQDVLTNLHGNTTLPKIHGAARAYEVTGEQKYRDIAINFYEILSKTRIYATGGSGTNLGRWPEPNHISTTLSSQNQELDTIFNWLRLCNYLFRWTGEARYGDMYERVFFNGILAAQHPVNGMFTFCTPLKAGCQKEFGTPTNSFWSAYGTGIQAFADLSSSIYFHNNKTIIINLFIPSTVSWNVCESSVRIVQTNNYPLQSSSTFTIQTDKPQMFELKVRIPWWTNRQMTIKINGTNMKNSATSGEFYSLTKEWNSNDVLQVIMPMTLHLEPANDNPEVAAIMYGPLVLAALTSDELIFRGSRKDLSNWIRPIHDEPLSFQTIEQENQVKFIPLYKVIKQEYSVYFKIKE